TSAAAKRRGRRASRNDFKLPIPVQGEFMIRKNLRILAAAFLAANLAVVTPTGLLAEPQHGGGSGANHNPPTTTPIKHLVVIFQENISFDHYFGTYPI